MSSRATYQADNVVAPRLGAVLAQAVDATARPYNIGILPLGGKARTITNQIDHIYLTLHADGGDVHYYFNSATSAVLDNTVTNAAGAALTATSMASTMSARIPSGAYVEVRIERSVDTWLIVKTVTGTATLRMWASSQAEV